ncbi:MAG: sigma-54 specific flagellar transcriptional regulator A [Pseudohongiellaceae bacterium]
MLYPHGIVGINDLPKKFRHLSDKEIAQVTSDAATGNTVVSVTTNSAPKTDTDTLLPLNGLDLKEYLANLEKDLISQALDDSAGVVARAADRLNIRRTTLVEKMRKYSLQKKQDDEATQELACKDDSDDENTLASI